MCRGGGARRGEMEIETRGGCTRSRSPLRKVDGAATSSRPCSGSVPPVSGLSYIEHRVSKMDTLAGVAIKYGVEVADIKRLNGLVTDIQMFGHRSIQIPLPGRHPPSHIISHCSSSNGEKSTPAQKKVSSAMRILQGYYGLTASLRAPQSQLVNGLSSEEIERERNTPPPPPRRESLLKEEVERVSRRGLLPRRTSQSQPVNGLSLEEIERERKTPPPRRESLLKEEIESFSWQRALQSQPVNRLSFEEIERERKTPPPPPAGRELLLKEERGSTAFSARASGKKGLALRQKSPSVTNLVEAGGGGGIPASLSSGGGGENVSLSSAAGKVPPWRGKGSALEGLWRNKAALD